MFKLLFNIIYIYNHIFDVYMITLSRRMSRVLSVLNDCDVVAYVIAQRKRGTTNQEDSNLTHFPVGRPHGVAKQIPVEKGQQGQPHILSGDS